MGGGNGPQHNSRWIPRREHERHEENEKLWREAHEKVHVLEEAAQAKQERVMEVKTDRMNELRTEVITDRGQFVTRKELYAVLLALASVLAGVVIALAR
jgi:hypothetical protein